MHTCYYCEYIYAYYLGPRACKDADGRTLGRKVFKEQAPQVLGTGKWSVESRGYKPKL